MANFCANCGSALTGGAFCQNCGASVNGGQSNSSCSGGGQTYSTGVSGADIIGTLVTVSLIGGMTRRLYYYGGRYFLDPYCMRPFMYPHHIMHMHRYMPPRHPGFARPPIMYGPRGPHHFGGPRGPHGPRR